MTIHRNVRLLSWFYFWADFRPYGPIAILYFSQVSGSYALGMSIYSVVYLAQSLFEVPTGVFSDMIGRKQTAVCGALASVLSLTCYAIGGTYWMLLLGAVFEGLMRAFYSGNNHALLYDSLAEDGQESHFQEYIGKTSAMFEAALGISAVIGSLIAALSFQIVMWLSVLPMLLSLFVALRFVEPRTHTPANKNVYAHLRIAFQNIIRNPRLRTISAASIVTFAVGESSWLIRSAFVQMLWPVWALGFAQLLANIGAALSLYFAGRIIRRFGEFRLLIAGITITEATNLFSLLVRTVFSPVIMASNSIFFGVNSVSVAGLLQHEFSDEQRATMGSLNSFGGSIVFAFFSFLLGALADRFGVTAALVFASLIAFVPMALYWRGLRTPTSRKIKEPAQRYSTER